MVSAAACVGWVRNARVRGLLRPDLTRKVLSYRTHFQQQRQPCSAALSASHTAACHAVPKFAPPNPLALPSIRCPLKYNPALPHPSLTSGPSVLRFQHHARHHRSLCPAGDRRQGPSAGVHPPGGVAAGPARRHHRPTCPARRRWSSACRDRCRSACHRWRYARCRWGSAC